VDLCVWILEREREIKRVKKNLICVGFGKAMYEREREIKKVKKNEKLK
jgi:hypothetical protein